MKNLKKYFIFIVLIFTFNGLSAKNTDLIILMDSSGSILPWFEQINGSIISNITEKFIRKGDIFHLISFNSRVNLEIVQPIQTETDISRIVSRLMLLYPLGNNSDFLSGIQYAIQYGSTLNQNNDTILIIISDGIFNPPSSSPFAKLNVQDVEKEIYQFSHKIRNFGWKSYYIKLPYPEKATIYSLEDLIHDLNKEIEKESSLANTSSVTPELAQNLASDTPSASQDTTSLSFKDVKSQITEEKAQTNNDEPQKNITSIIDISKTVTDSLKIEYNTFNPDEDSINFIENVLSLPEVTFPQNIGKVSKSFVIPFKVKNAGNNKLNLELKEIKYGNLQILSKRSFISLEPQKQGTLNAHVVLPHSIQKGKNILELELVFSDDIRAIPQKGSVEINLKSFTLKDINLFNISYFFVVFFVIIFIVLVLILLVFILNRASNSVTTVVKRTQDDAILEEKNASLQSKALLHDETTVSEATISQAMVTPKQQNGVYSSASAQESIPNKKNLFGFERDIERKTELNTTSLKKSYQISFDTQNKDKIDTTNISVNQLFQLQQQEKLARSSVLNSAIPKKMHHHTTKLKAANSSDTILINANNSITLQLFVKNQNTNIGKRNVKTVKAGNRLSIGGKGSAFYIFLVKFPKKIAEVRWDGNSLDLALLKPEYFPYVDSNIITNCIDKDIVIVSNKNYEVTFKIIEYVDPLQKLNSILQSIMKID